MDTTVQASYLGSDMKKTQEFALATSITTFQRGVLPQFSSVTHQWMKSDPFCGSFTFAFDLLQDILIHLFQLCPSCLLTREEQGISHPNTPGEVNFKQDTFLGESTRKSATKSSGSNPFSWESHSTSQPLDLHGFPIFPSRLLGALQWFGRA